MVALRDGLRWGTEGRVGAGSAAGLSVVRAAAVRVSVRGVRDRRRRCWSSLAWVMRNLAAGRAVYATGSNDDAARLAGLDTARVTFGGVRRRRRA